MKVIFYTIIAIILDILIWGTFVFVLMSLSSWVDGKEVTIFHYFISIFYYLFFEGIRLYITDVHEYMKRSL